MKYTYKDYKNKLEGIFNKYANRSAIVSLHSDDTKTVLNYSDVLGIANNIGKILAEFGLKRADRIAVVTPHSPYAVVLNLSLAYLGYTAVLIDGSLPNKEINKLIDFSDVCAVFTITQIYEKIDKSLLENIPVLSICEDFTYSLLRDSMKQNNKTPTEPTNEGVIAIIFSSGTTDTMKGVQITYSSILKAHEYIVEYTNLNSTVSFLNILPSNHIAGYSSTTSVFLSGGEMGFPADLSPTGLAQAFSRYNPTNFIIVPQVYEIIMRKIQSAIKNKPFFVRLYANSVMFISKCVKKITGTKLRILTKPIWKAALGHNMKICGCGTAPCSSEVMSFYLNLGIDFVNVYGSTETGFPITATNCNDKYANFGTGNVFQFSEIKIKIENPDKDGVGEIRVKSPLMMLGYFKDTEKTDAAFDENGFFKTGDCGYVDKKGNLFVTGRIKEAILLRNGKKVSPSAIDEVYQNVCKGVLLACVGVPCKDNSYDEIHLFVQKKGLDNNETQKIVEQIKEYSSNINPMYKIHTIHLIEEIPTTTVGKIKRYMLKEISAEKNSMGHDRNFDQNSQNSQSMQVYKIIRRLNPNGVTILDDALLLKNDLGFDSLSIFELCVEIENVTGVNIAERINEVSTVGDIVNILHAVNNNKGTVGESDISKYPHCKSDKDIKSLKRILNKCRKTYNFEVAGMENIPSTGNFIICSNHINNLDPIWLLSAMREIDYQKIGCLAAVHLFNKGFSHKLLNKLGAIPVDRGGNTSIAVKRCKECLLDGYSLIIFPEGARSRDGNMLPFKNGAAALSAETGTPILPARIDGGFEIFPRHKKLPRVFDFKNMQKLTLKISFGKLIFPNGDDAQTITKNLKCEIENLKK